MLQELILSKEAMAALIGAAMGGGLSFLGTWMMQRHQRLAEKAKAHEDRQRLKEEKMYQLAVDMTATAYAFLSVTWSADNGMVDQDTLDEYFTEIQKCMPRIFGDFVILAGLDHKLGEMAGDLVSAADSLDVGIGKAGVIASKETTKNLKALRNEAEDFAQAVREALIGSMKKMRQVEIELSSA